MRGFLMLASLAVSALEAQTPAAWEVLRDNAGACKVASPTGPPVTIADHSDARAVKSKADAAGKTQSSHKADRTGGVTPAVMPARASDCGVPTPAPQVKQGSPAKTDEAGSETK